MVDAPQAEPRIRKGYRSRRHEMSSGPIQKESIIIPSLPLKWTFNAGLQCIVWRPCPDQLTNISCPYIYNAIYIHILYQKRGED